MSFSYQRGQDHTVLTGPTIELAGHRFATPAGFHNESSRACAEPISLLGVRHRSTTFTAVGAPNGLCVAASFLSRRSGFFLHGKPFPLVPNDSLPADVGGYRAYADRGTFPDHNSYGALYVYAPAVGGHDTPYLVLTARGLTLEQLAAIALSGLPASA